MYIWRILNYLHHDIWRVLTLGVGHYANHKGTNSRNLGCYREEINTLFFTCLKEQTDSLANFSSQRRSFSKLSSSFSVLFATTALALESALLDSVLFDVFSVSTQVWSPEKRIKYNHKICHPLSIYSFFWSISLSLPVWTLNRHPPLRHV